MQSPTVTFRVGTWNDTEAEMQEVNVSQPNDTMVQVDFPNRGNILVERRDGKWTVLISPPGPKGGDEITDRIDVFDNGEVEHEKVA